MYKKYLFGICVVISTVAYLWLGYFTERSNFFQLIFLFGILFAIYFLLLKYKEQFTEIKWLIGAAIFLRLLFLFVTPNLSNDYFRFIWDGRILAHGNNPFLYLPSEINGTAFAGNSNLTSELFNGLNSKPYYTCYPPVHQLVFGISSFFSPNNVSGSILVMRLFIILSEIGTIILLIKLLKQFGMKENLFAVYALNPLVIVELTGNLHFEVLVIFFLLLSFYFLNQQKTVLSASAFSLAAGIKLLPLIFLPLIIKKLGWKRGLLFSSLVIGLVALMFIPFSGKELINNFLSSIDLYFQKFEFNASIYYLVRWLGYHATGYNIIATTGIVLSIITFAAVVTIAIFSDAGDKGSIFQAMLFSLTIYFLFATTVHPWYITTLVFLSVFSEYKYAILWSSLITLTYFTYQTSDYEENLWLVTLEYLLVGTYLFNEYGVSGIRYFKNITQ